MIIKNGERKIRREREKESVCERGRAKERGCMVSVCNISQYGCVPVPGVHIRRRQTVPSLPVDPYVASHRALSNVS